ncbi:hypothetical protein [Chroogloeocystis siderophila]|jgi:hypothetical protein|nr:hypothetical protein [Chroogloeocystis siderophila]
MPIPKRNEDEANEIDVDAGTLLVIVSALIFIPLLLVGFFSQ